jgi:type I restriction enzyme M protein
MSSQLAKLYTAAHSVMRNIDGLQPQEAFDELLKYLFFKEKSEAAEDLFSSSHLAPEDIRRELSAFVHSSETQATKPWNGQMFRLSDNALQRVHQLFQSTDLSRLSLDTRSAALREFLSPELRRGLGIYLTPDPVVEMMVEFVSPSPWETVFDPACGSGTFLMATLARWKEAPRKLKKARVYGADKSPRMLQIAELNLGGSSKIAFCGRLQDSLVPQTDKSAIPEREVDVIFTNPPFGVYVDNTDTTLTRYLTAASLRPGTLSSIPSEILFIEQCLRYLKPGGRLAIVLPRSVFTNARLAAARTVLGTMGYVYAAVSLPSETFASTGTQTTTWVLFVRKYLEDEAGSDEVSIAFAEVQNIGYDATGRHRDGDQLRELGDQLRTAVMLAEDSGIVHRLKAVKKEQTFQLLAELTISKHRQQQRHCLGDITELISTGRTPARSAYLDSGMFILKVGNLTGHGIDWQPRERNFISIDQGKRRTDAGLNLGLGDIVLTSSAHMPKYIAKKVDIVASIPEYVGSAAVFVGEVMRIRCKLGVDPYRLLAFLRSNSTMQQIQRMVRGQTAHLMSADLADLPIPPELLEGAPFLEELVTILRRETELMTEWNQLVHAARETSERHRWTSL